MTSDNVEVLKSAYDALHRERGEQAEQPPHLGRELPLHGLLALATADTPDRSYGSEH